MARNCRNCGVIKWRCNCGVFWGEGETKYQPDQTDGFEDEEDETEDEEDEFEIEELAAWIEGQCDIVKPTLRLCHVRRARGRFDQAACPKL